MEKYNIRFKNSVTKDLYSNPNKDVKRILDRINALVDNPRPVWCEKLSAQERYRVKQGKYRILYEIKDAELIVFIVKIGHRRDVYNNK